MLYNEALTKGDDVMSRLLSCPTPHDIAETNVAIVNILEAWQALLVTLVPALARVAEAIDSINRPDHIRVCQCCGKPLVNIRRNTKRFCGSTCRTLYSQTKRQLLSIK